MNAALPVVQLPLFIGFFLGLRRMPDAVPEFATGGALWFQVRRPLPCKKTSNHGTRVHLIGPIVPTTAVIVSLPSYAY